MNFFLLQDLNNLSSSFYQNSLHRKANMLIYQVFTASKQELPPKAGKTMPILNRQKYYKIRKKVFIFSPQQRTRVQSAVLLMVPLYLISYTSCGALQALLPLCWALRSCQEKWLQCHKAKGSLKIRMKLL